MKKQARAISNNRLPAGIHMRTFLPNLVGGVTIGLMEIFFSLSFASLIFRGALESELVRGSSLILVSGAIYFFGIGLLTSLKESMATNQDVTSVLLAVIVAGVVAVVPPAAAMPTALAVILVATVFTGLVLLATGWLRLGRLIRFIPYPVIGGFLAATGWMLVSGAFPTITPYSLTLANLPYLLQVSQVMLWVPALALALVMTIVPRFIRHPLAMPAILAGSVALFYAILLVSGTSFNRAVELGLFFSLTESMTWQPLTSAELLFIDWNAILGQAGNIAILTGMTLVGITLNFSAIELAWGREFNLNREFRSTGVVNMLAGMAGGLVGYHALGFAVIGKRMQITGRTASVIAGLLCLAAVFSGFPLLMFLPKFLAGGMLLYLGMDFIYEWVWRGFSRFSLVEYAIVLMILAVIVTSGFLTGVVLGLLAMVVMFAVSYSRTSAILRSYSSAEVRSTVSRTSAEDVRLLAEGDQVCVLELQGFLFFGTASTLVEEVKKRVSNPARQQLVYLLLDFRQVTGIDSSSVLGFQKIQHLAGEHAFTMVLTGLSKTIRTRLQIDQAEFNSRVQVCEDLDHGLEWCENQLLSGGEKLQSLSVKQCLLRAGMPEGLISRILPYMIEFDTLAGESIIQKGEPSNDLFMILDGQVTVYRKLSNGQLTRARTLGPGSVMGEVGVYLSTLRTASITVDQPTRMIKITRQSLERMQVEDPQVAIAFHQMIVRLLAERVLQEDRSLWVLRR